METKIIFSEAEHQYLIVDGEGNILDKSPLHEEAIFLADKHEAIADFCWVDFSLV